MTGDTGILANLMYSFSDWSDYGLKEIWFHNLNKMSSIHDSVQNLPINYVLLFATIYALTGCDTTSKVGTKLQAFKAAHKPEHASLNKFGISECAEFVFETAERFLLKCIMRSENKVVNTFDELEYSRYTLALRSIRLHTQRAYCQSSL